MAGVISASTAIAAGGLALSAASTGASAIGSSKGAQASNANFAYQAQVARNNAQIAKEKGEYALEAGTVAAGNQSMKNAAVGGKIKAAQAANNVDVNTGSAVDVQTSQRETGNLDAETVLNNAKLKDWGFRVEASNDEAQAKLDEMGGSQASQAGTLGAEGSILGGASSLAFRGSQLFGSNGSKTPAADDSFVAGGSAGNGGLATA